MIVTLSFLFPGKCEPNARNKDAEQTITFDRVCLGQLSTILKKGLGNCRPGLFRAQTEVYVCARKVVHMKLCMVN